MSERPLIRPAYYHAAIADFLRADPDAIYGQLGKHHGHSQELTEKTAWLEQIKLLRQGLQSIPEGWLAFEFSIPRMGKRADAVVLLGGIIFVIEFKVGADRFTSAAIEQVTDYALDLKKTFMLRVTTGSLCRWLCLRTLSLSVCPGTSQWIA